MKRIGSLLLALVMMLALNVSALAAETTGSITVNHAVANQTYTIYRMFDLDTHNDDYTAVTYKVRDTWSGFFAEGAKGRDFVDVDKHGAVTQKKNMDAAAFAAAAYAFAKEHSIVNDGQVKAEGETVKFDNLPLGYYLVQSDLGALCALTTAKPNQTVNEKNSKPSVDKQVQEDSTEKWGDHNDADIGQTVNFKTTVRVTDGDPKNYVLHDKMSTGLTFKADSVVVKIGDRTLAAGADYTLVTAGMQDGCTFEIKFADTALKVNNTVTVEYAATVNDKAVIAGTGNPNDTWLTYGNNGSTEHDITHTYIWQMDAFKYTTKGGQETPLKDAQFVLYKEIGGVKYYAVTDANQKITGWTPDGVKPEENPDASKTYATVFTTPENGKFTITGLDADTYYLEEIKAPAGYNVLKAPVKVIITSQVDQTTNEGTATVTYNENSTGVVRIENKSGVELPTTGGIGTTILYVLGGLLAIGAGALLVTRRCRG